MSTYFFEFSQKTTFLQNLKDLALLEQKLGRGMKISPRPEEHKKDQSSNRVKSSKAKGK